MILLIPSMALIQSVTQIFSQTHTLLRLLVRVEKKDANAFIIL